MLVIIVPFRNRSTTKNWSFVSQLCVRSLRSFCQAGPEILRVFLVCRETPEGLLPHPSLTVISEEFSDPGPDHDPRERDKWLKLKRGLIAARPLAPAHILFADADDLIHRDLATLAATAPESPGWSFPLGYAWEEPSHWLYRWPNFDQYCGTSAMVRVEPEDLPVSMEDPRERFFLLVQGHAIIRQFMEARGTPLTPVPFPAAIYLTGTGENHSGIRLSSWGGRKVLLQKLLRARPITRALQQAFGMEPLKLAGRI